MSFLYVLIAVFAVVFAYIQTRPSEGRIQRSLKISAPASATFPHVNNLRNFNVWNPWAKIDPNSKNTYEGPAEGVGSVMRWEGNGNVGSGIMTCTESKPNDMIKFRMDFLKPMKNTQTAEFTFKQEGGETLVIWAMYGPCNFMGKAMGLLMNCDKMVGDQFEKGLANLKVIAESKS